MLVSSKLNQLVVTEFFKYLADSCQNLKLIVGPLAKELIMSAKEVWNDVEYTTSWFHLREVCNFKYLFLKLIIIILSDLFILF